MEKGKGKTDSKGKTKPTPPSSSPAVHAERYLSLLKKSLLNQLYLENEARLLLLFHHIGSGRPVKIEAIIHEYLGIRDQLIYKALEVGRKDGDWVQFGNAEGTECTCMANFTFLAHTMIGQARLDNLHQCLDTIIADKIPGDLIETGVWKGGATIFMRGYLAAHDIQEAQGLGGGLLRRIA